MERSITGARLTGNIKVGVAREESAGSGHVLPILDPERDLVVLQEVPLGDEAASGEGFEDVDVVLVDLPEDEPDPGAFTGRIVGLHPSVGVVVLACSEDRRALDEAVRAGAKGYLVKPTAPQDLARVLLLVASGHLVIDGRVADAALAERTEGRRSSLRVRSVVLSERNVEVLVSAASGLGDEEIARDLQISVGTVRRHLADICAKLDVIEREEAVAAASRMRFVLGRGRGFYAIWDVANPGPPIERFAEAERARAWLRWQELRTDRRRAGLWRRLTGWVPRRP